MFITTLSQEQFSRFDRRAEIPQEPPGKPLHDLLFSISDSRSAQSVEPESVRQGQSNREVNTRHVIRYLEGGENKDPSVGPTDRAPLGALGNVNPLGVRAFDEGGDAGGGWHLRLLLRLLPALPGPLLHGTRRSFPLLLRPRPGLLFSVAAFVRDSAVDVMGSFPDLLDALSGTSKGANLLGFPTWSSSAATLKQNRSLDGLLVEEGEGESYYVSLVKLVGWTAFRGERAPEQVLQVNPQPEAGLLQAMKIRSMFSSPPSLLGALAKSW
ncbi:uncharacterized protein LOC119577507 [Penaeus monodon]|uniref:uncharacterized protein LOC119577507 n=1 Tax=Penaeus monodon TaxID=6687 RepID=UPI0018A7708D|nr:uncharacterized protein LOC119577507 [Penaeus monodon]